MAGQPNDAWRRGKTLPRPVPFGAALTVARRQCRELERLAADSRRRRRVPRGEEAPGRRNVVTPDLSHEQRLDRLAEIAVGIGLRLVPGQELVVSAPIEAVPLTRRTHAR